MAMTNGKDLEVGTLHEHDQNSCDDLNFEHQIDKEYGDSMDHPVGNGVMNTNGFGGPERLYVKEAANGKVEVHHKHCQLRRKVSDMQFSIQMVPLHADRQVLSFCLLSGFIAVIMRMLVEQWLCSVWRIQTNWPSAGILISCKSSMRSLKEWDGKVNDPSVQQLEAWGENWWNCWPTKWCCLLGEGDAEMHHMRNSIPGISDTGYCVWRTGYIPTVCLA